MVTICDDNSVFTAIVRIDLQQPDDQPALIEAATRMIPVFRKQPGFISLSLHRGLRGTEIVTYLQWRSKADHEACQSNPEVIAAGQAFLVYLASGRATIDVQTFEVVACADAT
jgi:heme-degrading monooxygenase HmoA